MARRRRSKTPRKRSSRLLVITQVIFLVGILIFILLFRDLIADGAGKMFGTFGAEDVQVQQQEDESADDADQQPSTRPERSGSE